MVVPQPRAKLRLRPQEKDASKPIIKPSQAPQISERLFTDPGDVPRPSQAPLHSRDQSQQQGSHVGSKCLAAHAQQSSASRSKQGKEGQQNEHMKIGDGVLAEVSSSGSSTIPPWRQQQLHHDTVKLSDPKMFGCIIGKGGNNKDRIETESGASITIKGQQIHLCGSARSVALAKTMIADVMDRQQATSEAAKETFEVDVSAEMAGPVLGKNMAGLLEIKKATGANIRVVKQTNTEINRYSGKLYGDIKLRLSGTKEQIQKAVDAIWKKMETVPTHGTGKHYKKGERARKRKRAWEMRQQSMNATGTEGNSLVALPRLGTIFRPHLHETSEFVKQGLSEQGLAIFHDRKDNIFSHASMLIGEVVGAESEEVKYVDDADWAIYPEIAYAMGTRAVGQALGPADWNSVGLMVAICYEKKLWAVGLAGSFEFRQRAAKVALTIAIAERDAKLMKALRRTYSDFERFCNERLEVEEEQDDGDEGADP